MKEQIIQFIMSAYQWFCQSETGQTLFVLWATAFGVVAFWGAIEMVVFAVGKVFGKDPPRFPAAPEKTIAIISSPIKTAPAKKTSVKKKSAKKPAKKKSKK